MVYEFCQDTFNKQRHYDPLTHMLSGGMAGGFAAAMTTPLDVCKTLLNTQHVHAATRAGRVEGMFQAIMTVYRMSGPLGFFKGVTPRVLYVMPGTAISWSVYEFFKYALTQDKGDTSAYVSASTVLALQNTEPTGSNNTTDQAPYIEAAQGKVLNLSSAREHLTGSAAAHGHNMPQLVDHLVKEAGEKQKI